MPEPIVTPDVEAADGANVNVNDVDVHLVTIL
jgi:hypothetical protein